MPDTPDLAAALTPEQWIERAPVLREQVQALFGTDCLHPLAAACLYQQPFGFDANDITWLTRMSFSTFDRAEAEAHQAWLQSFIARHTALLPPQP